MEPVDDTGSPAAALLTGVAAGVPYVALPPAGGARRAPLVVVWHLPGSPGSQHAMAAALPMARLPAWRTYLRLPTLAAGAPASGAEELVRPGADEVARRLLGPMIGQAVAGFPAVVAALRVQLKPAAGPIGLVGGSVGAAVALLVLAEGAVPVQAAALVSPAVQLDVIARAHQIAARDPQPALLLVIGARDDPGVREPAERLWHTLAGRYRDPGRVALLVVPDLGDALAEEPGPHPVPRTPGVARVDVAVAGWLDRHLNSRERHDHAPRAGQTRGAPAHRPDPAARQVATGVVARPGPGRPAHSGRPPLPPAPQADPNDQSPHTADHPRVAAPMTSHPVWTWQVSS